MLPDSTKRVEVAGVGVTLNATASVERPDSGWLDARYGGQGATLHLSVVHAPTADALDKAVANRQQRINLNIGESGAETRYFESASGFECLLIVTTDVCMTPVQVLAKGPGNTLVSGAFVFDGTVESLDSIRPVVQELEGEGQRILESLSTESRDIRNKRSRAENMRILGDEGD
ncbi:MAG: hypothetical protein K2J38_02565 [Muribaculaceae bacterium]|nr:hypothetical protein [Muribaculaceae bacterium]